MSPNEFGILVALGLGIIGGIVNGIFRIRRRQRREVESVREWGRDSRRS